MSSAANAPLAPSLPPPPRRRWLRRLGYGVFLLAALVVTLPYAINLPFVREHLEEDLSESLGTHVRLRDVGFSWFSGFSLHGLVIHNPQGFDPGHFFLRLESLRGDLALLQLVRGRIDLTGTVEGLVVNVCQDQQGRSNVEALFGDDVLQHHGEVRIETGGSNTGFDLGRVRVDLKVVDARVEICRESEILESLLNLDCSLQKQFGSQVFAIDLRADLLRPEHPENPGRIALQADVDAATMVVDSQITAVGLDLQRYRPLLAALLETGELTALQGVVNGTVKARVRGLEGEQQVFLEGSLLIDAPRIAGALLQGMDLQARQWTLSPNLQIKLGKPGELPTVQADRFAADLGFATVRGLTAAEMQTALPGKTGLGFAYTLDLDALAAFGGPIPDLLKGTGGRVQGQMALPIEGGKLPDLAKLHEIVLAHADLTANRIAISGFELSNLGSTLTVQNGAATLQTSPSTLLNLGGLQVSLGADLKQLDRLPFELSVAWKGGKMAGEAASLLRYVVPMLAGVDQGANLQGAIDLDLSLKGPSLKAAGESWLQFFNGWTGKGEVALANASLTPAPALQGLLSAAGGGDGKLSMERFGGGFTMRLGVVESQLMDWQTRSKTYHLVGTTKLDGSMDWGLDLADMLKDHKDGARVLAALGGKPLMASLKGTLDAPKLGMPDIAGLIQGALQNAAQDLLRQKASELLPGKAGELFRQGAEILKPKSGDPPKPPAKEPESMTDILQRMMREKRGGNGGL